MTQNVNPEEVSKFAHHAAHWWDEHGELYTLHQINPLRLGFIQEKLNLKGVRVLDVGCGGGILTESLAQAGASVTGIDLTPAVIEVAKLHQLESGTQVDYQVIAAEDMAKKHPEQYDVVTCFELLEHVPHPEQTIAACAALVKPGGHVFFSTLNRNLKSYLFSIIGAEYILKMLPRGTHDYKQFIKPAELNTWTSAHGLTARDMRGLVYHTFTKKFSLSNDIDVNYLFYATK